MQQFKVTRQRLILGGSKSAKIGAEYYFVLGCGKFIKKLASWLSVTLA